MKNPDCHISAPRGKFHREMQSYVHVWFQKHRRNEITERGRGETMSGEGEAGRRREEKQAAGKNVTSGKWAATRKELDKK